MCIISIHFSTLNLLYSFDLPFVSFVYIWKHTVVGVNGLKSWSHTITLEDKHKYWNHNTLKQNELIQTIKHMIISYETRSKTHIWPILSCLSFIIACTIHQSVSHTKQLSIYIIHTSFVKHHASSVHYCSKSFSFTFRCVVFIYC